MNRGKLIPRAAIATSLLAALVVPAANAISENTPNWGNSGKTTEEAGTAGSSNNGNGYAYGHDGNNGNGFGNGSDRYWGGCRGVHGGDNPGNGLGNGLGNGFNTGNGNGNANGHDKPWKQCGPTPPPPPPGGGGSSVEGSNYSVPETR